MGSDPTPSPPLSFFTSATQYMHHVEILLHRRWLEHLQTCLTGQLWWPFNIFFLWSSQTEHTKSNCSHEKWKNILSNLCAADIFFLLSSWWLCKPLSRLRRLCFFIGLLWDGSILNICLTHTYEAHSPEGYNTHQITQVRHLTMTDEHDHSQVSYTDHQWTLRRITHESWWWHEVTGEMMYVESHINVLKMKHK